MTPLRTIALATAVALPLAVLLSQFLPRWREHPAKVRFDCSSFAEGIVNENSTISPHELNQELVGRGVTLPSPPSLTFAPRYSAGEAEALLRKYEAAKKAYEAKWEDIKGSPEYQRAQEAILNRKRDESLRQCLLLQEMQEKLWPSR